MSQNKKDGPSDQADGKRQGSQVTFQIDPGMETGAYANTVAVINSNAEFIFDFGLIVPGKPVIKVISRVITSPKNAKHLLFVLQDSVRKYEARFGEIKRDSPQIQFQGPDKPIN